MHGNKNLLLYGGPAKQKLSLTFFESYHFSLFVISRIYQQGAIPELDGEAFCPAVNPVGHPAPIF